MLPLATWIQSSCCSPLLIAGLTGLLKTEVTCAQYLQQRLVNYKLYLSVCYYDCVPSLYVRSIYLIIKKKPVFELPPLFTVSVSSIPALINVC